MGYCVLLIKGDVLRWGELLIVFWVVFFVGYWIVWVVVLFVLVVVVYCDVWLVYGVGIYKGF